MKICAAIAAVAVSAAAPAWADRYDGAASLEYEAGYVHAYDRDGSDGPDGLGLAGARLRGQMGSSWYNYRAGIDLRAGTTFPGGFAYDVDLYAAGLGLKLGTWSRFGIAGGVGASGATGTMDDGVQFPVEAMLELAVGGRIRLLARGRVSWLAAADTRSRGAETLPFGDELDAQLAIRFGRRWVNYGYPVGNGYYLGVNYREAESAKMVGFVIGHSIDAGTR